MGSQKSGLACLCNRTNLDINSSHVQNNSCPRDLNDKFGFKSATTCYCISDSCEVWWSLQRRSYRQRVMLITFLGSKHACLPRMWFHGRSSISRTVLQWSSCLMIFLPERQEFTLEPAFWLTKQDISRMLECVCFSLAKYSRWVDNILLYHDELLSSIAGSDRQTQRVIVPSILRKLTVQWHITDMIILGAFVMSREGSWWTCSSWLYALAT